MGKKSFFSKDYHQPQLSLGIGLAVSDKFYNFLTSNFDKIFITTTGIRPGGKVEVPGVRRRIGEGDIYISGEVSTIILVVAIRIDYWNRISFCWKSKSGKIVHVSEEDFDENDLDCWLEDVNTELYWNQLNMGATNHPFTVKNLPYLLNVSSYAYSMYISAVLRESGEAKAIEKAIEETIVIHNVKTDANSETNTLSVHNWSISTKHKTITVYIDGADVPVVKKILKTLAKFKSVLEVLLDRFPAKGQTN